MSYREVSSFQEPLYCGHLEDLVKCSVWRGVLISGNLLLWTPWGPGEVSYIERCPHFRGNYTLKKAYLGRSKVSLMQRCPCFRVVI